MGGFAWVTLATNDSYSLGALVLAHSLKQAGTKQQLAVLVTPGVTNAMREKLSTVFNLVQEVNILDSRDETNLRLLKRPELGITFTKLHCWRLTQFDKCVFLDADTLVLQNCDELFEREELSAAPDVGWPDCFNSGVFVYRPSNETYEKLITFALERGSFDGGDQGLLNLYFSDWAHKDISKHLPFIYNMCSTACYSYLPAFKQFGGNAKIIHFIGATKPWLQYFNTETKKVQPSGDTGHLTEVLQRWWDIFCCLIHPQLTPEMAGLAGAFAQLTLGVARTLEQIALDDILRRQAWELGNVDYLGKDSFENIWSKIEETLSLAPQAAVAVEETAVEQPKEPTTTPTPSEVKTPQGQSEATPEVGQETVTPTEEPKEELPPQTSSVSTVAIPSPSLKDTLPSPPIALPPPPEHIETPKESPVLQPEVVPTETVEASAQAVSEPVVAPEATELPVTEESVKETHADPTKAASIEVPKASEVPQPQTESEVVQKQLPKAPESAPVEVVKASQQQTVLSAPEASVVDTQKPTEEAKPVPETPKEEPVKQLEPVQSVDTVKPIEIAQSVDTVKSVQSVDTVKPVEQESVAAKPEELTKTEEPKPAPETAQPEEKQAVTPEVEGCPKPSSKSTKTKKSTKEPASESAKASPSPAAKSTETAQAPISAGAKPTEADVSAPTAKVTEATPPTSPPAVPQLKQTKEALAVDTSIPETPPPTSSEGAGIPVPPPRKAASGPKKPSAKPKK